ncbi:MULTISPECIES: formate dehydrogenase accessory sulfurtransferase FdhD [unclassified Rhodococcus (in: high G+C Gram-positive bacteria)]|uniref:formate dehydrogenase accessory sulfurtransferase FdhD n=1 Tax=unclassified Rhodococcus (in: high G+C Gram-positive bacteria) TaxID=192944 RepID=UPI00146F2700|nr:MULTISPECIES: formate dehydrogenase accessory sulfurtransferase FdhD [unclassified Rhodococcus (in: high G+C Gram-positive bacteria)]MBF0662861.1 formate dehydrogenase accessory sulfurtransferase FdhD [Rhodococcus sp. (in: high G+C Gram-positive bacteria)]NMD95167.1 formate dehydrogenase accessory sulfurtransferase FdhD [Rhodococcus sp. BL-253-APC-6A1W]NME81267.1 formate dehydrogenase accessory sulfurtransferase FdhD [Rhodococcus sp. 105337]
MGRVTARRPVLRITADRVSRRPDTLAVEEPLEIRLGGDALTITMRTPGHDVDLVHGFLLSEGMISDREDVAAVRYCDGVDENGANTYNVLDVALAPGVTIGEGVGRRSFTTTSACGVCGKESLDQVRTRTRFPLTDADSPMLAAGTLTTMPDTLRDKQQVFASTGGLHAAALFTPDGELLAVREDVGRHNAVDKVLGWALTDGRVPLSNSVLMVSGRASFELVQKAVMAGVPVLAAVSAPSSLAVDLAAESGLTLVGFLRGDTMNVYTATERVKVG